MTVAMAEEAASEAEAVWTAQEIRFVDRPDEIVGVLENGMIAIVKENHTAPVAAVRMYVRAGSIYEEDHYGAGMSHLFEHLLAGGATRNRTEEQSRQIIRQIGAKYNAYTTKDHTCYYLTVPGQHIGSALNLIADWVTRPTFPEDAFEREWGVVQRELEMGFSDPIRQQYYLFDEMRYKVNPGQYPIIGYQKIVQQLTRQDILDYYHRMYVPDNTVVVIAGDINAEEMFRAIKKEFSDFTRRAAVEVVLPDEPDVTAPREVIKVFPSMQGPAKMTIGFPSFKLQHPDLYVLDTLANIMGEGQSSRLYRTLREEKQLVLSISAGNYTPHWADGTFMISCDLAPENVAATRAAIWEEISRIQKDGITEEELNRAKRQLEVGHIRSHQTAEEQASSLGRDYLATGDPHFSDHYVENMQKVTAEQVQAMAVKYLLAQKQITLVLTPTALAKDEGQAAKKNGEAQIKKITLENGLRVLLKRNEAVPLVNMQLFVLGGMLDETDANSGITSLMAELATKGTASYSANEIVDYFDGIGGSMDATSGNNTYFYTSEVLRQDFAEAFKRYGEIILKPTFPEEELAKLQQKGLAIIAQINNNWHLQANRNFREKFFVNSPYRRTKYGTVESISQINREQIQAFYEQSLVANRAVLAIFGDINIDETEKMIREHFAAMPAGTAFGVDRFEAEPAIEAPRQFVDTTERNGATVYVGFPGIKITDMEDRYSLEVLMEIIGSHNGRIFEQLRGMQLVYDARCFSFPGVVPGYISAMAQCEADKAPQVIELIKEQLAKAVAGEFSEEEITDAKNNRINAEVLEKQTNADAAMTAALDELYGLGYNWSDGNADRIMAITLKNVQDVAKKYLSGSETVTVITSAPDLFTGVGNK
jgi:zinc protease